MAAECPGTGGAMVRLGPAPPPQGTRTLCPMLKVDICIFVPSSDILKRLSLFICVQEISKRNGHCDLMVRCRDGQVQVHSFVMAAQSKVSNPGKTPAILF